jgi:transcriptional regulator with XRE-family HTH domain
MNVLKVGSFIRARRMSEELSLRKMAVLAGVSLPYLSQVERGLRKPSAEILQAIARGLRISAETLYVQAGILDERPASDLATAVMADLSITESQKRALLQIYQAFREETGRSTEPVAGTGKPKRQGAPRKKSARTTSAGRAERAKAKTGAAAAPRTRRAATKGRRHEADGGTVSQAGSSPHPAPTRSPVITSGATKR